MVEAEGQSAESGEAEQQDVLLEFAETVHLLCSNDALNAAAHAASRAGRAPPTRAALSQWLDQTIERHSMAPAYERICELLGWPVDTNKCERLRQSSDDYLSDLSSKITEAESKQGDLEVTKARKAHARQLALVGKKDDAIAAYDATIEKTVGLSQRMEQVFDAMRVAFAHADAQLMKRLVDELKAMLEQPGGGDWEVKNRLKVYEGCLKLMVRDFHGASTLFLDSLSTFSASELFPYERLAFYAAITAVTSCNRVQLRKRVVHAPEVLQVVSAIYPIEPFMKALQECRYADYLSAFVGVCDMVRADYYAGSHERYFAREARARAYSQFLESYRSVTLANMAASFGVSSNFMDGELASFIAAGKVSARIDKPNGIVKTTRQDIKNSQYQSVLKQGDALLNRVQKLSRVVDL
jgi:26S proteasome regulatory subunit N7